MNLRQIPIRITAVTANCMLCVMLCMPAALEQILFNPGHIQRP